MLTRRQFILSGIITTLTYWASFGELQATPKRKAQKRTSSSRLSTKNVDAHGIKSSTNKNISLSTEHKTDKTLTDAEVRDYLFKMKNFDTPFPGDIILKHEQSAMLNSLMYKFGQLQRIVGHGKFYLLSIDEAIATARTASMERFSKKELLFLEEIFHYDASNYGFMGSKPLTKFTETISVRDVYKVPGMGNYIYRGKAQRKWAEVQKIAGNDVILTSGVRGIVKQFYLFLAKAQKHGANLSLASRSLAPPGYSFHGIGDFDVGQRGYGARNFTADFTTTKVYKQLSSHGYLALRYHKNNLLGVRFEPWHIKVIS